MTNPARSIVFLAVLWTAGASLSSQQSHLDHDDMPMQPNGRWYVHDSTRPQPRVVDPGGAAADPVAPPVDATILVGTRDDISAWRMLDGRPATWRMREGVLEAGGGDIRTRQEFSDFQLHVEFATPIDVRGDGQERGNSGVYLLGAFEIQILDSYRNQTYPDGQAAAMYGQYPPLVNASRPPGDWQMYDIVFTAPRFEGGSLAKPAVVTVFHNNVLVHNATAFWGPTAHAVLLPYDPALTRGPIVLQDHGNPVHFRNIWIRPVADYDQP
jgi:hypothetical protein